MVRLCAGWSLAFVGALLSHVLDEEVRIAQALLIDDELAEDKPVAPVAVRAYHRVVSDASV